MTVLHHVIDVEDILVAMGGVLMLVGLAGIFLWFVHSSDFSK